MFTRFSLWSRLTGASANSHPIDDIVEFREFAMSAFRKQPGVDNVVADPDDRAKFNFEVGNVRSTADLTNLFGYLKSYPEENKDRALERFMNSILTDYSTPVDESQVVAVIRNHAYVDHVSRAKPGILHEPLAADLSILYMADRPDSMAPVTSQDLPDRDIAHVRQLALDNVRTWLPKVVCEGGLPNGALYYVQDNPMLSTSLILLDGFWDSILHRFPGDVLVALPRKDQLFLFDDIPTGRTAAIRMIDVTFQENFNLLSPMIYRRQNGKIVGVYD